jgi:hypothetical protein
MGAISACWAGSVLMAGVALAAWYSHRIQDVAVAQAPVWQHNAGAQLQKKLDDVRQTPSLCPQSAACHSAQVPGMSMQQHLVVHTLSAKV